MQFDVTKCAYLGSLIRENQNQEQTQELKLTEGMPDIGRVLSAWGQVILRGKEWRSDCVSVNGGVMVWVLYAPEDGTEPRCLESWIPFQMKWDFNDPGREGDIRVCCNLRFVDARSVSARKLMLRTGVAARCEAFARMDTDLYSPGDLPEDVQLLKTAYPIRLPKEAGERTFVIDEELSLPGSCPKPEKIIFCQLQPEVTDSRVMGNRVVFRGTGNLHVLYRSDEGQLHAWDFELPFSQFADLKEDHSADAQADFRMCVTSLELESGEEGNLRLKCGLLGQFVVDDRQMVELVQDAYSPLRTVTAQTELLRLPAMLESRRETMTAEQTIPQDANVIVDAAFTPDQVRLSRMDGRVELEIPGQYQVLYYDENGVLQSASARWEGKSQLAADDSGRLDVSAAAQGRPQAKAGSGSIDLKSDVRLQMDTTAEEGLPMVTGLTLGEPQEKQPDRPSLILRRAGNARLWDIAKSTGSTVDAICQANGIQQEPLADQMLLIPVS